jgi:hypothetical protein
MAEQAEDNVPQIPFFDEQKYNLATITTSISSDSCVLVLGPLFGKNKNGEHIHEEMRKYLQEDNLVKLDDEYQNLFIIEDTKGTPTVVIEDTIGRSYDKIEPDAIYESVAKIKFNAIITFTQDIFLIKAFDSFHFDYLFTYFSTTRPQTEFERLPADENERKQAAARKLPFIYNVFGHYQHKDSLIYTYDKFYKFLFPLLGDSKAFPDELVNRLSNARVFLFMGFDLKKWYVPLFITKFCKLGRENKSTNQIIIAPINDTNTRNPEYLRWLLRYPLEIKLIKDTYSFLDKLIDLKDQALLRKAETQVAEPQRAGLTELQKQQYFDRMGEISEDSELITLMDDIMDYHIGKNETQAKFYMVELRSELKRHIHKSNSNKITNEEYEVGIANIRKKIMHFITEYPSAFNQKITHR